MKTSFTRLVARLLVVVVVALGLVGPSVGSVAAQTPASDEQAVRTAVSDLDRFEQAENQGALYDRLAPEFRNTLTRSTWLRWNSTAPGLIPTGASTINDISFGDWTWEATGDDFEDVATVSLTRSGTLDGAETTEDQELHFLFDGTRWRLLPDLDPEAITTQVEDAGSDFDYVSPIEDPLYAEIDTFWAETYFDAGLDNYRAPGGVVDVVNNAQISAGCGTAKQIEDRGMYYCTLDETIYFSGDFRDLVIDRFGEWAWITGVAHEWGHHIQLLNGLDQSSQPELDQGYYTIELELQADCISGMYSQDAIARGEIGEDELDQADQIMDAIGDPTGTAWDDPNAHGTSEQRQESFLNGVNNGFLGCRLTLE